MKVSGLNTEIYDSNRTVKISGNLNETISGTFATLVKNNNIEVYNEKKIN